MENLYEPTEKQIRRFKKVVKKEIRKRELKKYNNKKIIEYIALDIMSISYSKGGSYSDECLKGFMEGYFDKILLNLDINSILSEKDSRTI